MKLYKYLAKNINWYNGIRQGNTKNDKIIETKYIDQAFDNIKNAIDMLPHGSGIDGTNTIDFDKSNDSKIIIQSSYHCMDEYGGYDGWIDFSVIITPSLENDFDLYIVGYFSDRHSKYAHVKDYLEDIFQYALDEDIPE